MVTPDSLAISTMRPRGLPETSALNRCRTSIHPFYSHTWDECQGDKASCNPMRGIEPTNGIPHDGDMDTDEIVRANLQALLDSARDYPAFGHPATVLELEALSGIGKSTIYRMLKVNPSDDERPNTTIDSLTKIAQAYGVPVWHLLYPGYVPAHPPHVLTPEERLRIAKREKLYSLVKKIADEEESPSVGNGTDSPGGSPGGSGIPRMSLPRRPESLSAKPRNTRPKKHHPSRHSN